MALATKRLTDLRLFRRKDCSEIPVLVQDAHDFNDIVVRPIEYSVRMHEQRAKSRRHLVPGAPQERLAAQTIACDLYFASELVGNLTAKASANPVWPPVPRRSAYSLP